VGPPLGNKSNGKTEDAKPVDPTQEKSNKSSEKPLESPAASATQPNTENQTKPELVIPESSNPVTN
jgi:hypothetical protein